MARRSLGEEMIGRIDDAIRRSVQHAFAHPADSEEYVRRNAQEMDPGVMRRHIDLYVNSFSVDLGAEGDQAVRELLGRAMAPGTRSPGEPLPSAP